MPTSNSKRATKSALLDAATDGNAAILAVFGGQGTHNLTCLQDLRTVFVAHQQHLAPLMTRAASALSRAFESSAAVSYGLPIDNFDLMYWMRHPDTAPSPRTTAQAPISLPIIGLLSLSHYCITCLGIGIHPGQLRDGFTGTTGHSQGIVIAAVIAGSDSWDTFFHAVEDAMELLFQIGLECHAASMSSASSSLLEGSSDVNGATAYMLSVRGLRHAELQLILDECNAFLDIHERAYLALRNSEDIMTVAGYPKTLRGLQAVLEERAAPAGLDQVKIPYALRRKIVHCQLLPISTPFHSPHLADAARHLESRIRPDLLAGLQMKIPVYHTLTGEDLRSLESSPQRSTAQLLVSMLMCEPVDWRVACMQTKLTHILDFGPGKSSMLLYDQINGSGVRIVFAAESRTSVSGAGTKHEIFSEKLPIAPANWEVQYGPRLQQDPSGTIEIVTRMSEAFGVPPIMCAGMTPTTVWPDFVASVTNAGYHIELAGGGYSQPQDMEKAIRELASAIPAHRSITCNLIYVNPRAMAWQIPLIRRLRTEGLPIEGLAIGAGIPSQDVATGYIDTLGLKHIAFKPSSVESIRQVLEIAKLRPTFPIVLQWTGGRAGGHHSYEDLHTPILKTYASIRAHSNIVLAVGSGFGDAHGMLPYLTGQWSETISYARMPFDGILLGSRMMVAKEAHTSLAVKQLIVDTPGVTDDVWHNTYGGAAGGIITVKSEMGEPIHKIANRAVMLWSDLDKTIFNVKDTAKRLTLLRGRRAEIIRRLNTEYAKPWFAISGSGEAVEIEDLTYLECLRRIVELMYMRRQDEWVHDTYRTFFLDFVHRSLEASTSIDRAPLDESKHPDRLIDDLIEAQPTLGVDLLDPDDAGFFVGLCKRRNQKPVNFVPRLDESFETWFKKDSLWQMEKLDAVPDQDPHRVCIIHGPVAAKYSTSVNESAADILDKIQNDLIEALGSTAGPDRSVEPNRMARTTPSQTAQALTQLRFLDVAPLSGANATIVDCKVKQPMTELETELFVEALLPQATHWLRACLTSQHVLAGTERTRNRVLQAFQPTKGDTIRLAYDVASGDIHTITLYSRLAGLGQPYAAWSLNSSDGTLVQCTLDSPYRISLKTPRLGLKYRVHTHNGRLTLRDVTEHADEMVAHFYASLWAVPDHGDTDDSSDPCFNGGTFALSAAVVNMFKSVMAKAAGNTTAARSSTHEAPLDIGIVVAWKALTAPLVTNTVGGDLTRLLHRSNKFELFPGADPLKMGDELETTSQVTAIEVQPKGKLVEVMATIWRSGSPVMKVTSEFFVQGRFPEQERNMRDANRVEIALTIDSTKLRALLLSRHWFRPHTVCPDLLGKKLVFRMRTRSDGTSSIPAFRLEVSGEVFLLAPKGIMSSIGSVSFLHDSCTGNPVLDFLKRHGGSSSDAHALDAPGWQDDEPIVLQISDHGAEYSELSADYNPIHVSPVFAGFAGLPSPILHGMYTSAVVRSALERHLVSSSQPRFRKWSTSFEDIVRSGDVLKVEIRHRGMYQGHKVLDIEVLNHATNAKVMKATAEIEQAPTAYMFTGQGSQEQKMGLVTYDADPTARAIWDRGDRYLSDLYGFSLLAIVRDNPKKLTVHFRTSKGRKVRQNYLALTKTALVKGQSVAVPIIDGLTASSESVTFEEPRGLLFSTQFAQPAICLMEAAETSSLKDAGLIQQGAPYAGHSLGEYTALHACADFMTLEGLMGLTFYRGLLMQNQMERDSEGRTDFSMMAVDPSRVRKGFNESSLQTVVKRIASQTGLLLEIVNFNIAEQQYVCAGHLRALWLLGSVCDGLAAATSTPTSTAEELERIISDRMPRMNTLSAPVELQRGKATIPLTGVNVPFHSSYLHGGIESYREYLLSKFSKEDVVLDRLVGKFIPNVVAKPFATSREYVQEVAEVTGSKVLSGLLEGWQGLEL
ncbi:hypothetical protein LTR85_003795 [Meristemomyces frigidus]|nr:hypothetical protein LTR85_003795 [Meristemomyces frigidus]